LQEAELNCAGASSTEAQRLRRALWQYLAAVMAVEPTALSPEHAHLAIVLAAEYAPPGTCLPSLIPCWAVATVEWYRLRTKGGGGC